MSLVTSSVSSLLAPKSELPKSRDITSKEEFLHLLVTQLKHQDPLNPLEPENFSAQLAQFSSLEQLLNINSTLEKSQGGNLLLAQVISNSLAANLIGKNVKASGDNFYHISGNSEKINFALENDAKNVTIEIRDINGLVINKMVENELKKGENWVEWDGKDLSGVPASSGNYTIDIVAKDYLNNDVGVIKYITGKVDAVRFVDGKAYLLVNGNKIDISNVSEVFE